MARILVVEDNQTNLDLITYLLTAFGHTAVAVPNGLQGLDATRREHYDLVLCDILMPGIDGYEFATRFKASPRSARTPLVAVTALAMTGDREKIMRAGFDGYISKPIDPERFIAQIDSFLPAGQASATRATGAGTAQDRPTTQTATVLVVDDVDVNIDVVQGALQPLGYRVMRANTAREALEKAQTELPALVLCDIHMPRQDGFDLLRSWRADARFARTPFLLMSSTAWRQPLKDEAVRLGAAGFILRPIDPAELAAVVSDTIRASRG